MHVIPFKKPTTLVDTRVTYAAGSTGASLEERTAPIYMTPEFANRLRTFNDLVRTLRQAGVEVKHQEFPDNKVFICPGSAALLRQSFGPQLRGIRHRDYARYRRHTVTLNGVDVVWYAQFEEPRV